MHFPQKDFHPLRILLIEHHQGVRDALVIRLKSSPLVEQVIPATIGHASPSFVRGYHPDVILLGLPCLVRGGFSEVAARVQAWIDDGLSVIVLSSYASDEEREALIKSGVSRFLLKDINTPQLLDEIIVTLFHP